MGGGNGTKPQARWPDWSIQANLTLTSTNQISYFKTVDLYTNWFILIKNC